MSKTSKDDKQNLRSKFTGFALILIVAFSAYVLSLFDFFQGLELKLYDLNYQLRGPIDITNSEIAVVALDQPTFDSLSFPFDRRYYGQAVTNLKAYGAKYVVFDILLTSAGPSPASDSALYQAVEDAGNVVLCGTATRIYQAGLAKPIVYLTPPYPTIRPPSTIWGMITDFHDPDGVVRRYPLMLSVKDSVYLSLGLKVFAHRQGYSKGDLEQMPNGDVHYAGISIPRQLDSTTTLLNYAGPAGTFPTYSFIDVVNGTYDYAALAATLSEEEKAVLAAAGMDDILKDNPFKDKIVLIGASSEDLQDNKYTPFFSAKYPRKTPGVEVHANALQMFIDGSMIRAVNFWFIVAGVLLISFLTYTTGRHVAHWSGIVVATAVVIAILVGSAYLFLAHHLWLREMPLLLTAALGYPANLLYRFIQSQKEKAMIRGMFAQYVPKGYVQQLIQNPDMLKLGGERRRMTMLFSDIAGFSTHSEKLTPEELVALLNEYLTAMTRVVFANDGIVDKYEGDLVMAEFGAPIWNPNHAAQGCRTGLGMQRKLAELRLKWRSEGKFELRCRVGINTGDVIVGNMGSEEKFDYTVMGDAVNLASRLEGANKEYKTEIMIGHNTWLDVKDQFVTRPLDLLKVMGKHESVPVYELLAEKPEELPAEKLKVIEIYNQGITFYRAAKFAEAKECFEQALQVDPTDSPSQVYVGRCELYIANPPGENWDGVWTMQSK